MGFFSWLTADSKESIKNAYTDQFRPVYLLQPDGEPPILEPAYEGYGEFGGIDAHIWLAKHNMESDELEGLSNDMIRQYGILLDVGTYYLDFKTGISWGCSKHVRSLKIGLHAFPRFDQIIINGQTPTELIESGRWVRKPFAELVCVIQYPLKFSFDEKAIYEELPASERCPDQGYFPD